MLFLVEAVLNFFHNANRTNGVKNLFFGQTFVFVEMVFLLHSGMKEIYGHNKCAGDCARGTKI